MRVVKVPQNTEEWHDLRLGKITGSKLKDLVSVRGGKKDGFYQLIADKLAIADEIDEDARERGHRLEQEAIEIFEQITGKKVNKEPGMWLCDDNENIAVSPDGSIANSKGVITEAVEAKCLDAKNHLRAICEDRIPVQFKLQSIQYFVVNEDLKKLYFVFYDPRITARPFHIIEVDRTAVADDVAFYKEYEINMLKEVDEIVGRLAF